MIRRPLAFTLFAAGLAWSILFPKKPTLEPDMVLSVGVGVGLLGTGWIVLRAERLRRSTAVLSTMLLWSLVANAFLFAWQREAAEALLSRAIEAHSGPPEPAGSEGRR